MQAPLKHLKVAILVADGSEQVELTGPRKALDAAGAGRRIAAWPSQKKDLANAGAKWVDDEVCADGNLVTSRKPADIPAFNREVLKLFGRPPEELQQETPQPG